MQKYICEHCDNLVCSTSTCPVCGERTTLIGNEIYYCDHCHAPTFEDECPVCHNKCKRIGTDLRPVFAQERLLLEILIGKPFSLANKSVWNVGSNYYVIDGVKKSLPFVQFRKRNPEEIIEQIKKYSEQNKIYEDHDFDNEYIQNFIKCNQFRLNYITDEAIQYTKGISKKYDFSSMFVSFSGGKDSTVTSNIVMRALGTESIIHIYGDTTLEYPESKVYLAEFKKAFPRTPVLVAKNQDQDFNNLCEVVGPPSRVMRWCCTVFKTGSITKKIEQTFKDKSKILSFQGVRRSESKARSKYERDSSNSKITKQFVSSPIIDWTDFDIWLYLLSNKVPFNGAYRQGFSRVGCRCCPNNSDRSEFLSSIYMHEEFVKFRSILYKFAQKVGKEDWEEYINTGKWKARQGGNGLDHSKNAVVEFKPCAFDENSINFALSREISNDLYTLFKPFGILNFDIGNKRLGEVYVLDFVQQQPLLKLTGKIGSRNLKVTIIKTSKKFGNVKDFIGLVKNQITKYQTCIGCTYCQSVCKFNALKVVNLEKGNVSNKTIMYTIDNEKCVGCLECVTHFDGGCYMKKVLRTKVNKDEE